MQIQNMVCKNCQCENMKLQKVSFHVGAYCENCGKWQKWLSHEYMNEHDIDYSHVQEKEPEQSQSVIVW